MSGKVGASGLDADQLLGYYEKMLLLRRFEEKAGQLYGMGLIGGFCHLYIGQEAVAVGIQAHLKDGDSIITSYRDHGIMLAMDSDPKVIFAELMGKDTGCSRGKGGSMHMFDPAKGFYGGHGIVGAQVPIGTGLAFVLKYNGADNVCVTMFGDGAVNQGQVYESFNMAKLWELPVIYVVENNEYAMGTSTARCSSTTDLYKRGEAFGIPGYQVDGMSFIKVYDAMQEAVEHVKKNSSPVLLEMKTYRYRGHSMSDPAKYRSKEEVVEYREHKDPLGTLRQYMENEKISDAEKFDAIENKVKSLIKEAVKFAENSPEPDDAELYTDIYVQ